MKKLIVANWKGLPETPAQAQDILARTDEWLGGLEESRELSIVICPPDVYRDEVARILGTGHLEHMSQLGAQDIDVNDEGQLEKIGVRFVIIGHSDRRWKLNESDEVVNEKLKTTLRGGLMPIVCLGERTRTENWQEELKTQTVETFRGLTEGQISNCLIAYEPVWAISTNPDAKPDTPASAVQSMSLIRDILADKFNVSTNSFLYGGSVTPTNAEDFLSRPEVSGVLVGGASVRPDDFCGILSIASKLQQ